jgi:hypothetical protein
MSRLSLIRIEETQVSGLQIFRLAQKSLARECDTVCALNSCGALILTQKRGEAGLYTHFAALCQSARCERVDCAGRSDEREARRNGIGGFIPVTA